MKIKIAQWALISIFVVLAGFFLYQKTRNPYAYTIAEFTQKQQTFSPYTKYDPAFAVDAKAGKIHYIYKERDENDVWQIWTASANLDGSGWEAVQQTTGAPNKQRPNIIFNKESGTLYYLWRTGNDMNAAVKEPRQLYVASKRLGAERFENVRQLGKTESVDDTIRGVWDATRGRIVLAYTRDEQITTAIYTPATGAFDERVHTQTSKMNFIPDMAYDKAADIIYLVFPRAREERAWQLKDLWFASVLGNGIGYHEARLTDDNFDHTWPFLTLDATHGWLYVSYSSFTDPVFYSAQGAANVVERLNIGRVRLDGANWQLLRDRSGFAIFGSDETGMLYGLLEEPEGGLTGELHSGPHLIKRYLVAYDPEQNKLKKQRVAGDNGERYIDYDMLDLKFEPETNRLYGSQQVCAPAGDRGLECQVWTYYGKFLVGAASTLEPETIAMPAQAERRDLPELKFTRVQALQDKAQFNANRKLSMPPEFTLRANGQVVEWDKAQLEQIDNDKGFTLGFRELLQSYELDYKICAISDPSSPECKQGTITYP